MSNTLQRIEQLLHQQHVADRKQRSRRWRPSLRLLLLTLSMFAVVSAWLGWEIRQTTIQEQTNILLQQMGVKTLYATSESLLVALLPGKPNEPPAVLRRLLGQEFFTDISDVAMLVAMADNSMPMNW